MEDPLDPLVRELVELLDDDLREAFEERAAIIEFDAGLQRAHAECLALLSVLRRHPTALTRVIALESEQENVTHWLLTTNLEMARQHLEENACIEIGVVDLADVIDEKYGGVARVTSIR
jgi:hypothetical protein